jgi:hypothetical protein
MLKQFSDQERVCMSLEKETDTYQKHLPALLADEGKFAVICGDEVAGTYGTYEDALKIGYERCGLKPFLVRKIQAIEQVQHFSRDLAESCLT